MKEKVSVIMFDVLPVSVLPMTDDSTVEKMVENMNYMMDNHQYTYLKTLMVSNSMVIPYLLQGETTIDKAKELDGKKFSVRHCIFIR